MSDDPIAAAGDAIGRKIAELLAEIERLRAALATEKLEMRGMHDSMFELRTELEHWKDRAEAAEGALADEEENKR